MSGTVVHSGHSASCQARSSASCRALCLLLGTVQQAGHGAAEHHRHCTAYAISRQPWHVVFMVSGWFNECFTWVVVCCRLWCCKLYSAPILQLPTISWEQHELCCQMAFIVQFVDVEGVNIILLSGIDGLIVHIETIWLKLSVLRNRSSSKTFPCTCWCFWNCFLLFDLCLFLLMELYMFMLLELCNFVLSEMKMFVLLSCTCLFY